MHITYIAHCFQILQPLNHLKSAELNLSEDPSVTKDTKYVQNMILKPQNCTIKYCTRIICIDYFYLYDAAKQNMGFEYINHHKYLITSVKTSDKLILNIWSLSVSCPQTFILQIMSVCHSH